MENSLSIYKTAIADLLIFAKNILGLENKAISKNLAIQESILSRLKTQQYGKQVPYYKDLYIRLLAYCESQITNSQQQELQNLKKEHESNNFIFVYGQDIAKPTKNISKISETTNINPSDSTNRLLRGFVGMYEIYHLALNIGEGAISKSILALDRDGKATLTVPTENNNFAVREGFFSVSIAQAYLFIEFPENRATQEHKLNFCLYASKGKNNEYEGVYLGIGRFSKKPMADKAYFLKVSDDVNSSMNELQVTRFYAEKGKFSQINKEFCKELLDFFTGSGEKSHKTDTLSINELADINLISRPLLKWREDYSKIAGVYMSYSHNYKLDTDESEILGMPIEIQPNGVVRAKGSRNIYTGRCRWDGGALAIQLYTRKAYNSDKEEVYLGFMLYFIGRSGASVYNSGVFAFLEEQNNLACGREILVKEKDVVFEDMLYTTIPFSRKNPLYKELNQQTNLCDYFFGKTDNEIIVKPLPKTASQGILRDYEDYGVDYFHAALGYALQNNQTKVHVMLTKAFSHGFGDVAKEKIEIIEHTKKGKLLYRYAEWIKNEMFRFFGEK